jgi:hypothetical protein
VFEPNIVILPFSRCSILAGHAGLYSSTVPIAVFRQKSQAIGGLGDRVGEISHEELADCPTGNRLAAWRAIAPGVQTKE